MDLFSPVKTKPSPLDGQNTGESSAGNGIRVSDSVPQANDVGRRRSEPPSPSDQLSRSSEPTQSLDAPDLPRASPIGRDQSISVHPLPTTTLQSFRRMPGSFIEYESSLMSSRTETTQSSGPSSNHSQILADLKNIANQRESSRRNGIALFAPYMDPMPKPAVKKGRPEQRHPAKSRPKGQSAELGRSGNSAEVEVASSTSPMSLDGSGDIWVDEVDKLKSREGIYDVSRHRSARPDRLQDNDAKNTDDTYESDESDGSYWDKVDVGPVLHYKPAVEYSPTRPKMQKKSGLHKLSPFHSTRYGLSGREAGKANMFDPEAPADGYVSDRDRFEQSIRPLKRRKSSLRAIWGTLSPKSKAYRVLERMVDREMQEPYMGAEALSRQNSIALNGPVEQPAERLPSLLQQKGKSGRAPLNNMNLNSVNGKLSAASARPDSMPYDILSPKSKTNDVVFNENPFGQSREVRNPSDNKIESAVRDKPKKRSEQEDTFSTVSMQGQSVDAKQRAANTHKCHCTECPTLRREMAELQTEMAVMRKEMKVLRNKVGKQTKLPL
jgi:hypothetical protein